VTDIAAAEQIDAESVLACAASMAYLFPDPFFRAISEEARYRGIALLAVDKIERIPGLGLQALLDGSLVQIGNAGLVKRLEARGVEIFSDISGSWKREGKEIVWVIAGGLVVGAIGVIGALFLSAPKKTPEINSMFRSFINLLSKQKNTL